MPGLREAAEKLSKRERNKILMKEQFEDIGSIKADSVVEENFLKKNIESRKPSKVVTGIDGGLLKKRYSSGDVVAVRAVGATFNYGEKLEVSYMPSTNPEPEFYVFEAYESDSINRNAESERLKKETEIALKALSKGKVLLDGSVVPSYLEDEEVLENYNDLFGVAKPGQLIGVVEDSYGLKMAELLEEKLDIEIGKIRDTVLMDVVLESGERSFVRKYSSSPVEHPVLRKLKDRYVNRLYTFYVKLSDKDLPLRIDYYGEPGDADQIASDLNYVKASKRYTAPAPVVEADKKAKISEKYIKRLEKRFSPDVKRRDRRLF